MEQKDLLLFKIISVIFLICLMISLAGDVFRRQSQEYQKKQEARKNEGTIEYNNEILGIFFRYPANWGAIDYNENISTNYLFAITAPEALSAVFEKKGLGKNYLFEFRKMDIAAQLNFLKSGDREYEPFLSKQAVITFSKNPRIRISAFNKYARNMSGYEAAVAIYPFYTGNMPIDISICKKELYKDLTIENADGCYQLFGKFLQIKGISNAEVFFENNAQQGERIGGIISIANLNSKNYSGLVVFNADKKYQSPPDLAEAINNIKNNPEMADFQKFLESLTIK